MKSKIQELIKHGDHKELQNILAAQPLEISKTDIDKLIAIAEYTEQYSIVNILQEVAKSLIKDEAIQVNSLNTTNDTDKEESININITLSEEFTKIKVMIKNNEDIKFNNKDLLIKHDRYNDVLMHLVCSLYMEEQNEINRNLLYSVKKAYESFSLNPNIENSFGVTPAEIIGDVDYDLAEQLFKVSS